MTRPRVRTADGAGELPIPSYELFTSTEILGKMAMEKMLAGLSTRRYPVGLEPVGEQVAETSSATSRSAVSRRFVAMTETALAELLAADLSRLDLIALMIDGVHFAESCCVVALGVGIDGVKHPLALVEGSTENATLVTDLLVGLRERDLDVTRPMLVGLDGSKATSPNCSKSPDRRCTALFDANPLRKPVEALSNPANGHTSSRHAVLPNTTMARYAPDDTILTGTFPVGSAGLKRFRREPTAFRGSS